MFQRRRSIVTIYGKPRARSTEAQLHLTQAYRRVFTGSPTKDDQDIVLTDLATKSGFYRVSSSEMSNGALRQQEGMRELFSHISRHLSLAPEDITSLENAARLEAVADNAY